MNAPRYREEVNKILASLGERDNLDQEPETNTPEPIQDVYVFIVRENPDLEDVQVIDSVAEAAPDTNVPQATDKQTTPLKETQEPLLNRKASTRLARIVISMYLFLIIACMNFQLYLIFHPPTATITIIPKAEQITLTGTLQLGRVLNPIALSQSQTAQTTGHGHQDARNAVGSITFYNGQLQSVFVPAGTILTGNSGEQIATDQDANIPPESQSIPPTLGQATVSAHAISTGSRGNIPAGDINQGCCAIAIKVINTTSFSGGQDERDFQTVAKSDIDNTAAPLKATLAQSVQGALQGQLKTNEGLVTPSSCTTTTTADHRPGEEATTVKVTVSETCSAVAYDTQALETRVTQLLTTQATKKLGAGYSLLGDVHVSITQAGAQNKTVVVSFVSQGLWAYALTTQEQERIKDLIKGKTKQEAMHILQSLPGIGRVSIAGVDEQTHLSKDTRNIHIVIIYGM